MKILRRCSMPLSQKLCSPFTSTPTTAKLIVLVRGSVRMDLYDNDSIVIKQTVLRSDGETFYVVPQDAWHNLTCLESGSVIYIQKNGKFNPKKIHCILSVNKVTCNFRPIKECYSYIASSCKHVIRTYPS